MMSLGAEVLYEKSDIWTGLKRKTYWPHIYLRWVGEVRTITLKIWKLLRADINKFLTQEQIKASNGSFMQYYTYRFYSGTVAKVKSLFAPHIACLHGL